MGQIRLVLMFVGQLIVVLEFCFGGYSSFEQNCKLPFNIAPVMVATFLTGVRYSFNRSQRCERAIHVYMHLANQFAIFKLSFVIIM